MKNLLGLLLIIIGLVCCQNYNELKNEELRTAFIINSSPTFKGYFYEGSDDSFHYFASKWTLGNDKSFKIASDKLTILGNFKFEKDKDEIRIDVLKNGNTEFAVNEYCKLYIVNVK